MEYVKVWYRIACSRYYSLWQSELGQSIAQNGMFQVQWSLTDWGMSKCSTEWHVPGTTVYDILITGCFGRAFIGRSGSARRQVVTSRSVNLSATYRIVRDVFCGKLKYEGFPMLKLWENDITGYFSRQKKKITALTSWEIYFLYILTIIIKTTVGGFYVTAIMSLG